MDLRPEERVLLVDDDRALLDAFRRNLRKSYALQTACGPEEALERLAADGPFAVVVSDYKMPGIDGIQFLQAVEEHYPDAVRVMLTGNADLRSAIDAVNKGHVFRFLTKPCEPEEFKDCLEGALVQYRLKHSEKVLLEQTLRGSVEVLSDVLALAKPVAFGRATRIRECVRHVVHSLELPNAWQYETAAMLSQIGCVAVPDDLLERLASGEQLSPSHIAMVEGHPKIAKDLLGKIPRLRTVADMISCQRDCSPSSKGLSDKVRLGGQILGASLAFEEYLSLGASREQALRALKSHSPAFDRRIVSALASMQTKGEGSVLLLPIEKILPGMVLQEDIRKVDNTLIVPKGHKISSSSLQRLVNFAELELLARQEYRVCTQLGEGSAAA